MSLRLYLHQPTIVFAARVAQASFQYPIAQVQYDTVTTGTYSVVGLSMTVLFGSSAGAWDKGISRVRLFPTSDTLYFGLSSQGTRIGEVDLADNDYITVIDEPRIWSKVPFIDADGETFYDGDIAYTNEADACPPVANAGPAFVGTIDPDTEVITVNLSATDSFVTYPGAAIASYLWNIGDGTVTSGDIDEATLTVTFPAGMRFISLLVADDEANGHMAYVPILAIDPDNDPTIDAFQITRHTITPDGQPLSVRLLEDVSEITFLPGGFVLIADGEPADGSSRDNVLFAGWVDTEDADIGAGETGLLRDTVLNLVDVGGRLKQLPGYSQVLSHAASPTKWGEMNAPSMDRFIHQLLQWQSNALDLANFTWSGTGSTYAFAELFADGSNLWDQVDRKAQSMLPDRKLTCSRLGWLKVLPDPLIQQSGDRTSVAQANLTTDDYTALSFQQQRHPRVYWLRANAIQAGTSTPPTALFAIAPGTSPGQGSAEQVLSENLAVSQTTLNQAAGHHYARLNAPQGVFTVTLAGSGNSSFDPARMDWVALTITSAVAAQRGLTFTEARFLLHQLDIRYNYGRGGLTRTNTLRLERETTGIPAVTYTPPAADPPDTGDFVPDDTAPTPPSFDGGLPSGVQNVAMITADGRYIVTNDFQSSPPTWTVDNSIQGNFSGDGMGFVVDPFSSLYRTGSGTVDGFYVTTTRIYKVTDIFGTPAETSLHTFAESISTAGGRWRTIAASFGRYQPVESDNPWVMVVTHYNDFGTKKGTYCIYSVDGGQTWSSEIQITSHRPTGSLIGTRYWPAVWMSPRTPGYAIVIAKTQTGAIGGTGAYYTTDWGATWAPLTSPAVVTSPQSTTGGVAGGAIHVPWPDNADEQVIYHGYEVEQSSDWQRYLYRTTGSTSEDITPAAGNYGPRYGLFAIRSYDNDRRYMVAVLAESSDDEIDSEETAVFTSADYGDNWTLRLGPDTTAANSQWPNQAAFSGDSEQVIFAWGNEAYIRLSVDGGANWENKRGSLSFLAGEDILAIVGG